LSPSQLYNISAAGSAVFSVLAWSWGIAVPPGQIGLISMLLAAYLFPFEKPHVSLTLKLLAIQNLDAISSRTVLDEMPNHASLSFWQLTQQRLRWRHLPTP